LGEGGHESKGSTANDGIWGKCDYVSNDETPTENDTIVTKEFNCELENDWIWPSGSGNFYIPPGDCSMTNISEDLEVTECETAGIKIEKVLKVSEAMLADAENGIRDKAIMCKPYHFQEGNFTDYEQGYKTCLWVYSLDGVDCEGECPQSALNNSTKSILFDVRFKDGKSLLGPYGNTAERIAEIAMYETLGMQAVYDILLEFNGVRGHKIITDSAGYDDFEETLIKLFNIISKEEVIPQQNETEVSGPEPPPTDNDSDGIPVNEVKVEMLYMGSNFYPPSQFSLALPDNCKEEHWHSPHTYVFSMNLIRIQDPYPNECGFGPLSEAPLVEITLTNDQVANWERITGRSIQ